MQCDSECVCNIVMCDILNNDCVYRHRQNEMRNSRKVRGEDGNKCIKANYCIDSVSVDF